MHGSLCSLNSHPAVVAVTGIALAGRARRELIRDLADVAIGTRFGNPRLPSNPPVRLQPV